MACRYARDEVSAAVSSFPVLYGLLQEHVSFNQLRPAPIDRPFTPLVGLYIGLYSCIRKKVTPGRPLLQIMDKNPIKLSKKKNAYHHLSRPFVFNFVNVPNRHSYTTRPFTRRERLARDLFQELSAGQIFE